MLAVPGASAHDHHRDRSVRVYYAPQYYGHSYHGYAYGGEPVFYHHVRYYPYYEGPQYCVEEHRRVYYRPNVVFTFGF
ncbi:MAG: hypothetical protein QM796_17770 [Chthoniobacteraceae bacterium]